MCLAALLMQPLLMQPLLMQPLAHATLAHATLQYSFFIDTRLYLVFYCEFLDANCFGER